MCLRCEGYSWDDIERGTDLAIRVHGFQMVQVEGRRPWTYTIGLRESWERPELLVVDVVAEVQQLLVAALADDVRDRGVVAPATLDLLDVELLVVDGSHFADGLVAGWESHYSRSAHTGDFLQIVPGASWLCECCVRRVRRLEAPRSGDAG